MPEVITGIRTLAKNLREAYVGCVRQNGIEEGETVFRKNVSQLAKNLQLGGGPGMHPRFSIRQLAEGMMGEDWYNHMRRGNYFLSRGIHESQGAVDVSAFSNITGQILIDRIRDNFAAPAFIGEGLAEVIPVVGGNLGKHREPWLSRIRQDPQILAPLQEYPEADFIEQYIDLAAVEKRGEKCSISMEMIYADKTKQAMDRADEVGWRLGYNKEERILNCVAGFVNNFTYMGTGYNTYGTSGLWINKVTGAVVTDYKGVTALELLFANMTDLVTGRAIQVDPNGMAILCTPPKLPELKIALHSSKTRTGPFATSGALNTQTEYDGLPLVNDVDYPLLSSKILYQLLIQSAPYGQGISASNAKEYVWIGNFKKAFYYRQAMPLTTTTAPPNNPAEFNQDIAVQVKAMEWGVAGTQGPQQVALSINA